MANSMNSLQEECIIKEMELSQHHLEDTSPKLNNVELDMCIKDKINTINEPVELPGKLSKSTQANHKNTHTNCLKGKLNCALAFNLGTTSKPPPVRVQAD